MKQAMKKIQWYQAYPYLIILAIALIFALPQLHSRGIYLGADTAFHFNRAFEAMQRLKHLNFHNMTMSLYGFGATGRIVNAFYGPGLGYCFGLILLVTQAWLKFQLITNFVLTFGTIALSYWLFNKYSRQPFLSLTVATLLSLTSYWALTYWYQSSGGMPWGMMFLPLVIDAGMQMTSGQNQLVKPIKLGITMAIILECHMLSFIFSVFIISAFFIVALVTTNQKLMLVKQIALAGLISVGLTLGYWIDYLTIIKTQPILSPFIFTSPKALSTNPYQGLAFWLIVLSITLLVACFKQVSKQQWLLLIFGLLFLFIASAPAIVTNHWNDIAFFKIVQFPMRFTLPGLYLLSFFVILSLTQLINTLNLKKQYLLAISIGLLLIGGMTIKNTYISNENANQNFWRQDNTLASKLVIPSDESKEASQIQDLLQKRQQQFDKSMHVVNFSAPDYLPGKDEVFSNDKHYQAVVNNLILPSQFKKRINNAGNLEITWYQAHPAKIQVPAVAYRQTVATLNGKQIMPKTGLVGVIDVVGREGENQLILGIKTSLLQTVAYVSPIIVIVILLSYQVISIRKRHNE
ncbi:cytochrome B [Leuconostoc citreum]|uniref:cytochrome B n=1 Tax=Leuconostoc citreum TaxID=33964 RepID=UPI0032E04488